MRASPNGPQVSWVLSTRSPWGTCSAVEPAAQIWTHSTQRQTRLTAAQLPWSHRAHRQSLTRAQHTRRRDLEDHLRSLGFTLPQHPAAQRLILKPSSTHALINQLWIIPNTHYYHRSIWDRNISAQILTDDVHCRTVINLTRQYFVTWN